MRSNVSCERSFHDLCARTHARSLEGTLTWSIIIDNGMHENICQIIFGWNIYVRSNVSCVRSSHDLCVCAHARNLDVLYCIQVFI